MSISELAKNWAGKNGQDNFKKAKGETYTFEDSEVIVKELGQEANVIRAKLKEATADLNDVNNTIAYKALNGSLDEETSERLGKCRENAQKSSDALLSDLYDIKEAMKIAIASW